MSETLELDAQVVAILEAMGDEATYQLLRKLLRQPATKDHLEDEAVQGLDQSGVSRRLKLLVTLGLVSGGGRGAAHSIVAPEKVFAVVHAVFELAEEINARRQDELRGGRKRLAEDALAAPREPVRDHKNR
jgi:hypothetical protein